MLATATRSNTRPAGRVTRAARSSHPVGNGTCPPSSVAMARFTGMLRKLRKPRKRTTRASSKVSEQNAFKRSPGSSMSLMRTSVISTAVLLAR